MQTTEDWDQRFKQQAIWTKRLRHYLYSRVGLWQLNHIIEVGCGTGAILADFTDEKNKYIYGLDISQNYIRFAQQQNSDLFLSIGDANHLPYKSGSFNLILCHFFLLWINDPILILQEMKRIATKDSSILVLAEPDYGGRIDYPDELKPLGQAQISSLISQGADPFIGRRLGSLFHSAGISLAEMGILGGQWRPESFIDTDDVEWKMLSYDLQFLSNGETSQQFGELKMTDLQNIHREALLDGKRVLFIPTFYAWGKIDK